MLLYLHLLGLPRVLSLVYRVNTLYQSTVVPDPREKKCLVVILIKISSLEVLRVLLLKVKYFTRLLVSTESELV